MVVDAHHACDGLGVVLTVLGPLGRQALDDREIKDNGDLVVVVEPFGWVVDLLFAVNGCAYSILLRYMDLRKLGDAEIHSSRQKAVFESYVS